MLEHKELDRLIPLFALLAQPDGCCLCPCFFDLLYCLSCLSCFYRACRDKANPVVSTQQGASADTYTFHSLLLPLPVLLVKQDQLAILKNQK